MSQFYQRATALIGIPALTILTLLVASGALSGCGTADFRPAAVGREGEIVIVIDSTHWNGSIGEALYETVGGFVSTLPAPERDFDLRAVSLRTDRDLEMARRFKNVIFVAPLSDTTNEAAYLRNVFEPAAQEAIMGGDGTVVPRQDLWRRAQQIYYVTGATADDVVDVLRRRGHELSRSFNSATRQRMAVRMFERGRQRDLEDQLMQRHGFAVNVQHDYQIAIDSTDAVWLRRITPDTWRSVLVHYVENADPGKLSPTWIYAMRDSLAQIYLQGNLGGWVEIDRRRPLETRNIDFLGRYGFESRGLWRMVGEQDGERVEFGMGGSFVTYTFYDQDSGRIYVIDGMVFAPGYTKREFMRQMEVIAYTFRTVRDTEEGAAAAADPQDGGMRDS